MDLRVNGWGCPASGLCIATISLHHLCSYASAAHGIVPSVPPKTRALPAHFRNPWGMSCNMQAVYAQDLQALHCATSACAPFRLS